MARLSMSLLLEALEASGAGAEQSTDVLPDGTANASYPVVAALLNAGADPRARIAVVSGPEATVLGVCQSAEIVRTSRPGRSPRAAARQAAVFRLR